MGGLLHRSLLRSLLERWSHRRLERLEERDWRRRIILASRRIQSVHMALSADVADVRGLKAKLSTARPAVERLNQELGAARQAAESLSGKLAEHLGYLQGHSASPGTSSTDLERIRSLEAELERTRHELRGAAERTAHESSARWTPAPDREEALKAQLAGAQRRVAELELQLRGLGAARAEMSQTQALLQRVQGEATQRLSFLEGRLRSAEDQCVQIQVARERREQELLRSLADGEARVRDLEARLAEAVQRCDAFPETEFREELEGRVEELRALVAEFEGSRENVRRVHGREIAEQTARILELEAFCQELEKARASLQDERDGVRGELQDLRAKWEGVEEERRELEERQRRLLADADAAREAERKDLEAERETLRLQGEERARQNAEEILELSSTHGRVLEKLQDRLRESEMARVELETRHQREMIDFADHSRERIRSVENALRERDLAHHSLDDEKRQTEEALRATQALLEQKEHEAEELRQCLAEMERKNERVLLASQELEGLQDEVKSSGQRLGERATRLLDIMRRAGNGVT